MSDQLLARVFRDFDEFFVDRDNVALEISFGDDAGEIAHFGANAKVFQFLGHGVLRGHIDSSRKYLGGLAVEIEDGRVGGLQPQLPASFAQPTDLTGVRFAAVQLGPKFAVFRRLALGFTDKNAVMATLNFSGRVSRGGEEIFVGG